MSDDRRVSFSTAPPSQKLYDKTSAPADHQPSSIGATATAPPIPSLAPTASAPDFGDASKALAEAQRFFLSEARKANSSLPGADSTGRKGDSAGKPTLWGPGGVGGIAQQGSQLDRLWGVDGWGGGVSGKAASGTFYADKQDDDDVDDDDDLPGRSRNLGSVDRRATQDRGRKLGGSKYALGVYEDDDDDRVFDVLRAAAANAADDKRRRAQAAGHEKKLEATKSADGKSDEKKVGKSTRRSTSGGGVFGLLEAAASAAVDILGPVPFGSGFSKSESDFLSNRYNQDEASERLAFACDKIKGGYEESRRKSKMRERRRKAEERRMELEEIDIDKEEEEEVTTTKGKEEVTMTNTPTTLKAPPSTSSSKPSKTSPSRKVNYASLGKKNVDPDDENDEPSSSDEEGVMWTPKEPKQDKTSDTAPSSREVIARADDNLTTAAVGSSATASDKNPAAAATLDADSDEDNDVDAPSQNKKTSRKFRDAEDRAARRDARYSASVARGHRIIEMDPKSIALVRQQILEKREAKKRQDAAKATLANATALAAAVASGSNLPSQTPPPPPQSSKPASDSKGGVGIVPTVAALSSKVPTIIQTIGKHVKQNWTLVRAIGETLESDDFIRASTSVDNPNWAKPPPPPLQYDGRETSEEFHAHLDIDGGHVEWRSETRLNDLKRINEDSAKPTHAQTLVDILDTISDLRDDIEKLKREKRTIALSILKMEKNDQSRKKLLRDGGEADAKAVGPDISYRLAKAKNDIEEQLKQMEDMLRKLQESRKILMHGKVGLRDGGVPAVVGGRVGGDDADDGDGDGNDEDLSPRPSLSFPLPPPDGEPVGGLEGLRERRRKRGKSPAAASSSNNQTRSVSLLFSGPHQLELENLWNTANSTALATGASAEIAVNEDGNPMYYKLLLNIHYPRDVSAQQRDIYAFLKQASVPEQVEFITFSIDPAHASDLLAVASAFLKLHSHSNKAVQRFQGHTAFRNPMLLHLLCCAATDYHVEYLTPVLALLWLFAHIDTNRAIMIRQGVVGTAIKRLKNYANVNRRKPDERKKGVGLKLDSRRQALCALTFISALCFK